MKRLRVTAAATAVLLASAALALSLTESASAATSICSKWGTTTIQGKYVVMNNVWGADTSQCIDVTDNGFKITSADHNNATNGAPASYPAAYYGCHYKNCSPGTILPLPVSDSRFDKITTTSSMTYPGSGTWDASYDIWFDPTARKDGQNTGAELMVWMNRQGPVQPSGSKVASVNLAGGTWDVWYGNIGWNVISYVRTSPATDMNFAVKTFFDDVVQRGYGQRSWYLTSIQVGFEPWIGGAGLSLDSFSVDTDGTVPTQTPTKTPTQTPTGSGDGCSASYKVTNQWQGGFQGEVTVTNTGNTTINGWTVNWTWSGGQKLSQAWNATVTSEGSSVTARSLSHNGGLSAGAGTAFGFIGSGDADPVPAPTCTAG